MGRTEKRWIAFGYKANSNCHCPNGGEDKLKVAKNGGCASSSKACKGQVKACPDCGIPYCELHFPTHRSTAYYQSRSKDSMEKP
jgi:hypothetical protein